VIRAVILRDKSGEIEGFDIQNHGETRVCAAVSALAINCVNSLETLAKAELDINAAEDGGDLRFRVKEITPEASLLLRSLELGLRSIKEEYPKQLEVI
jgi:hypothetical protein